MSSRIFGSDITNALAEGRSNSNKMHRPVVISIEAAIGTGKSTLLNLIEKHCFDWVVVQEPVRQWQSVGKEGHNLLEAYYTDQSRYAFSFQTYCVLSRVEVVKKALEECPASTKVVVLERSWLSDRFTFAEMLRERGKISPLEWELYQEWYNFAVQNGPKIDGHVYLECSTDTCMTRLRKRARCEETTVTKEYQTALIQRHEQWLETLEPSTVCRVNVDSDFLASGEARDDLVDQIKKFVDELRTSH